MELFPLFVMLFIGTVFLLVISSLLYAAVRGFAQWSSNNSRSRSCRCRRRSSPSVPRSAAGLPPTARAGPAPFTMSRLSWARAIRRNSGSTADFGVLVEGDAGTLTCQGTRYLGFDRHRPADDAIRAARGPQLPRR